MIKVNFYLRDKNKPTTLIVVYASYAGRRHKASSTLSIAPANWDPRRQRARAAKNFPQHILFNQLLDKIRTNVESAYLQAITNDDRMITKKEFLETVKTTTGKRTSRKKITLLEFIDREYEKRVELGELAYNTLRNNKTCINVFKTYAKKNPFDFNDIDLDFFHEFKKFLFVENNFSQNYAAKILKTLKVYLNQATAAGINQNLKYKNRKFAISEEDVENIYYNVESSINCFTTAMSATRSTAPATTS